MRKIYMARKVSLIVIWPNLENKMARSSYLMLNGIILLKRAYISLIIATGCSKCENNLRKSRPETLFQLLTFTFDLFFNVKSGYLTTKALYFL